MVALFLRCAPVLTLLVLAEGCVDAARGVDESAIPCDPGDGAILDDAFVDAGFCDEAGVGIDVDSGEFVPNDAQEACAALRLSTCGANNECERDPGCVAADLVARFEPERCAESAGDARSFPACALGNCSLLVSKVCGPTEACDDAPGCDPARELARRADGGDVSADASCAQALADDTLFPGCL